MPLRLLNSGVTGPKFTKFLHDVAKSSQMKPLKSELRYSTPFWNAKKINKGELPISPKLFAMSLERPEKGQINNLRSYIYHVMVKIW